MDPATVAAASDWNRPAVSVGQSSKVKRQAPLPPLSSPPLPFSGCVDLNRGTPDASTISCGEWHSATDGPLGRSQLLEVAEVQGGVGLGGHSSSTPTQQGQTLRCSSLPGLSTIIEEPRGDADASVQESPHLAALFSPEIRVLVAASNGEWSSEEEGDASTTMESAPTASSLLQLVPPHTRQSRVNLLLFVYVKSYSDLFWLEC